MIKVTVIITSYMRPDLLAKTLLSLEAQSYKVDEVVITDDGSSTDIPGEIAPIVGKLGFTVKFVRQEDIGFRLARSRNNGIREASGDLIIFSDQDLLFTRDYIKTFVDNATFGEFLVSWPVRLTEEQSLGIDDEMIASGDYSAVITKKQLAVVKKQNRKDRFYTFLNKVGLRAIAAKLRGGVCAIWREDLLAVNGYDERYQGWGNEDDDLGWRLHQYGIKGRNVTLTELPLHIHHPSNSGGDRPNKDYYIKRLPEIRAGDFRCEYGINTPLGDDKPTVTKVG